MLLSERTVLHHQHCGLCCFRRCLEFPFQIIIIIFNIYLSSQRQRITHSSRISDLTALIRKDYTYSSYVGLNTTIERCIWLRINVASQMVPHGVRFGICDPLAQGLEGFLLASFFDPSIISR